MKLILKQKRIFIYSVIAFILIIIAACIPWKSGDIFSALYAPLKWMGDGIRNITLNKSLAGGWILYLLLGAVPLIFPIVKTVIKRRFSFYSLIWVLLSIFGYIMLYFYINPHLLNSAIMPETMNNNEITLLGFEITFFIVLIICVLIELAQMLNSKPEKSYIILKLILDFFVVLVLFGVCFIGVLNAKSEISGISAIVDGAFDGKLNKQLNYFSVIFSYCMNIFPAILTVLLLIKCSSFIDLLKADAFSTGNVMPLKQIIKFSKLTVLMTLVFAAINNISLIMMSKWLVNVKYYFQIPLVMLGVICIVIIFSQILIRAIKLNEEQKLVI